MHYTVNSKVKLILEYNFENIKSDSVVSYMYNAGKYGAAGHIMYIEAVKRDEITGKVTDVIYSESWYRCPEIGKLKKVTFNKFKEKYNHKYDSDKTLIDGYPKLYPENENFQGYIQFK